MFLSEKQIEAIVESYKDSNYIACIHPIFDETEGQYVDVIKSKLPKNFPVDKLKARATSTMIPIERSLGVNERTGEARSQIYEYDIKLWPPLADGGTRTDHCGKASSDFQPKIILEALIRSTQFGSTFTLAKAAIEEIAIAGTEGEVYTKGAADRESAIAEALSAAGLEAPKSTVKIPVKAPVAKTKHKPPIQTKRTLPKISAPPPLEEVEKMAIA